MKVLGGRWWLCFEWGWRWFAPFNVLPRDLWGFGYFEDWYDGPLYELRLGFFNITWNG